MNHYITTRWTSIFQKLIAQYLSYFETNYDTQFTWINIDDNVCGKTSYDKSTSFSIFILNLVIVFQYFLVIVFQYFLAIVFQYFLAIALQYFLVIVFQYFWVREGRVLNANELLA